MNELDEKARRRIAQLEQELEFWRNYLAMSDQARSLLGEVSPGQSDRKNPAQSADTPVDKREARQFDIESNVPVPAKASRVKDNPKPAVVVEQAIDILRKNGHPMSRRELHTMLGLRGIDVRGADPVKALGTMLWRAPKELIQIDGYGYWPREDPYPPADYHGGL